VRVLPAPVRAARLVRMASATNRITTAASRQSICAIISNFGTRGNRSQGMLPGAPLGKHGELARSFCRPKVKMQGALSPLHARPQIGLHEDTFMTRVRLDCTEPT
jgi:hypothetical protein